MGISSLKVLNSSQNIIYKMIAASFALLCLTQVALGASESESQFYGQPGQFGGQRGQYAGQYPGMQGFYSGDNSFQLRPEDHLLFNNLVLKESTWEPKALELPTNCSRVFSPQQALLCAMARFKPSGDLMH